MSAAKMCAGLGLRPSEGRRWAVSIQVHAVLTPARWNATVAETVGGRLVMIDGTAGSDVNAAGMGLPRPSGIGALAWLVGTWDVSGAAEGVVTYEWALKGTVLFQYADLHGRRGLEILSGADSSTGPHEDVRSRFFGPCGHVREYVWDTDGDSLTVWRDHRGSAGYFHVTFGTDGKTLTGAWHQHTPDQPPSAIPITAIKRTPVHDE